jgi:hypothetical protein
MSRLQKDRSSLTLHLPQRGNGRLCDRKEESQNIGAGTRCGDGSLVKGQGGKSQDESEAVTYICALSHPVTGAIHYVGKSDRPQVRVKQHCGTNQTRKKREWISNLRKSGLRPAVIILESVIGEAWRDRERFWIKFHRENGSPLLNQTAGGDGSRAGSNLRWRVNNPEAFAFAVQNMRRAFIIRKNKTKSSKKIC